MSDTRRNLHRLLKGKQLYSALYGVYTKALHDLTAVLKQSAAIGETAKTTITTPPSIEEVREQRRRKRKPTDDADKRVMKPTTSTTRVNPPPRLQSKPEVPTRNFFDPLRSTEIEADYSDNPNCSTESQQHRAPSNQAGGPPPVVLTSQVNLIQLQKQLKGLLKEKSEFSNTRNGTRIVLKGMSKFSAIHSHFEKKSVKIMIHLSFTAPAKDISDGLEKQMPASLRLSAESTNTVNFRLSLITLQRSSNSHEIFKLTSLAILKLG
jgi:hypothetical protein